MALISENKFKAAIANGAMDQRMALEYLANERNNLAIVTMSTVGAFSASLANAEADARQKLNKLEADAAVNVPMIERLMTEQGWSTQTFACKSCGKQRPSKSCSMCYEPSEY